MSVTERKIAAALLAITTGMVMAMQRLRSEEGEKPGVPTPSKPAGPPAGGEKNPARTDRLGDPLPPGALPRVGTARLWAGQGSVEPSSAFLDGGKILASREGGAVHLWDTRSGKELRVLRPKADEVYTFTVSPDHKTLVMAGRRTPLLQLWDVGSGKEIRRLPVEDRVYAVAFSPDGKQFAAARRGQVVVVWDTATWKPTRRLTESGLTGGLFAFGPGSKTLVATAGGYSLRWWDVQTGKEVRRSDVGLESLSSTAASPDGKRLAVLDNRNLSLRDGTTGAEVWRVSFEGQAIRPACFSPDGKVLVCGDNVGKRPRIRFLDVASGKEAGHWEEDRPLGQFAFSPDGKVLAYSSDGVLRLRNVTTGKPVLELPRLPGPVLSVHFPPDGRTLLTGFRSGHVGVWDPLTGKPHVALRPPTDGFAGLGTAFPPTAFTPNGKRAALRDEQLALHIWEPRTGKKLARFDFNPTFRPLWSPDGGLLAFTQQDTSIGLWKTASGKVGTVIRAPHPFNWPGAFSPDGRVLATYSSSGRDPTIRLWDVATGKERGRLAWANATHVADLLNYSPDGKTLVSAHCNSEPKAGEGFGPTLRIWDVASRKEVRRIPLSGFWPWALVVSPDGKTLAVATHGTITLWETATGKERGRWTGHRAAIRALAFSPDGRLLASGSEDHTALLWDVTGLCPEGKWAERPLTPAGLKRQWADLGGEDAARAYRARWRLAAAPRQAIPFLAERLRPVEPVAEERIARWIADLNSNRFPVRQRASQELAGLGDLAGPPLRKALTGAPSLETRRRLEALLDPIERRAVRPGQLAALRALEVLEQAGGSGAEALLERLARGAPGARLTQEARASLDRLRARRP